MDEEIEIMMEEFEHQQNKQVYRTSRKIFRDYYKTAIKYKDNDTLTRSQLDKLTEAVGLGMLTLEYLNVIRQKGRSKRSQAKQKRLDLERAVLRRRVDKLRDIIIHDPDKKSDSDLEEKV